MVKYDNDIMVALSWYRCHNSAFGNLCQ